MLEPSPQNGLWLNFASFWTYFGIDFGLLSASTWHPKRGIVVVVVVVVVCSPWLLALTRCDRHNRT